MLVERIATVSAYPRHLKEPARRALTREARGRAALLAAKAEGRGEYDLAAALRNLARTAPRARAA
jgi:hypothetical protein